MKTKAFTLAEVLITLMVIGILAMVTIPSILQSWEEQATVAKLKNTYSILQQAYQMTTIENGPPNTWGLSTTNPIGNMKRYLNYAKDCAGNTGDCVYSKNYKLSNNTEDTYSYYMHDANKLMLHDGVVIAPLMVSANCVSSVKVDGNLSCSYLYVDVNGSKSPNEWGVDLFVFSLTKAGILPWGGNSPDTSYKHDHCKTTGKGCTRWVTERGNMDYLHKVTNW